MWPQRIAVIGANGAIGRAFVTLMTERYPNAEIHAFARHNQGSLPTKVTTHCMDYHDEVSIQQNVGVVCHGGPLDLVIVATGILHDQSLMPEKSLRDLSAESFQHVFAVNTIVPALLAKHFLPRMCKDRRAVFAALSARVGSISDNGLGGWYAYRASKAALNMVLKNAAIEAARRNKDAIVIGLHPGTVDSDLSQPFQGHVEKGKLFTPAFSVERLIQVLEEVKPSDSGKCFAWDGKVIPP